MKEHYHGHRQRLKEKFAANPTAVFDYELMELLLGYVIRRRDVKPQAKKIIEQGGGLSGLFGVNISDIEGLGPEVELFVSAVKELCTRIELDGISRDDVIISDPSSAVKFLRYLIGTEKREMFVCIFLDNGKKVISHSVMASGTIGSSAVYPREIAAEALKQSATSVIISHNHPSGGLKPSPQDVDITIKIQEALKPLEIDLADHIIVTEQGYYSFKSELVI